ncbi:MAG: aldo/keto reductase [Actinomycetota bacterium]|nr:aldo/keto reductase [Actinomycetota bacterium]
MRFVEVGGVRVSAIGLGTWQFGSPEWGYGEAYAAVEAGAIVERALDLGVNLVDTAEVYGFGRSERIVGQAIAGRRTQAFVATKVFPVLPIGPVVEQRGRASARRLGVECIDLYQMHWPNPVVPVATTMAGMRRLQATGAVANVGVSNFSLRRWRSAERALGAPVLSNQVRYSLVARRPERQLLPYAAAGDRLVIAYSPLAQGLLSGRWSPSERPGNGVRRANPLFLTENLARVQELLATLAEVARAHDATAAQAALAWVIRRPNTVAIPGARTVAQLEANVAAADLELTDEEDAALTAASDAFRPLPLPAAIAGGQRRRTRRPA